MHTIRCLMPFGSLCKRPTPTQANTVIYACMRALSVYGKKEQKGSTPGWSHPLQITICTRHLRTALSGWRENKQTENGRELGKWGLVLSGCSQVFTPGCQSYCRHHRSLSNLRGMAIKTLLTRTALSSMKPALLCTGNFLLWGTFSFIFIQLNKCTLWSSGLHQMIIFSIDPSGRFFSNQNIWKYF